MIKKFFWFTLFLYLLVIIKFFISDYSISYDLDDVHVKEFSKDGYVYLEIEIDENIYNYMFYSGRKLTKKRVSDVKVKEVDDATCVKPTFKSFSSYYVCNDGTDLISYSVVNNSDKYEKVDENVKFYKNLSTDEHVYIWKYDGFYYLNGDKLKSINIFKSDRYSNDLMIKVKNFLVFPNYDGNYLFSGFVVLDMTDGSYEVVDTKYSFNYDSYFVGNRKNYLYLFDNKESKLYEINYKKGKVSLIGDDKKGFVKYVDGKKENAQVTEYLDEKITYFDNPKSVFNVRSNYFSYDFNDLRFKYFNESDIDYVDSVSDNLYFIFKDKLYRFNQDSSEMIFHYFEFNFNKNNNVFVYSR